MTARKQLHRWMKECNFLKSDYQEIRDMYFDTFQQVLPFRISVGDGINPKTIEDFRNELKRLGYTSCGNIPTHLTDTIGVKVKDCKDCEHKNQLFGISQPIQLASEETLKKMANIFFDLCSTNRESKVYIDGKPVGIWFSQLKFEPKDGDIIVSGWGDKQNGAEWIAIVKGDFTETMYDYYCLYITKSNVGNTPHLKFNDYTNTQTYTRPATEQEVQLLLSELQKLGKIWNAETKQIEDDTRIDVDKIDFKKCLAEKDFTPYFPTKEIQDMVREWDENICCGCGLMYKHQHIYNKNVNGIHCKGVDCIKSNCPFHKDNKSILLSMKPFFAKELTDKEKFDKWRDDNGYSAIVGYNEKQDKLSRKLSAINMLCLCAKYLNGGECKEGYYLLIGDMVTVSSTPN